MSRPLPRLALGEHASPFDEAVIVIDGREEETIRIECEGAAELASRLVDYVNSYPQIVTTLRAAMHALHSYEFGNASPDLAQSTADHCEALLNDEGAAA